MIYKKIKGVATVFAICIVFSLIAGNLPYFFLTSNTSSDHVQYIIDAGHGIPDGGTVGADGTTEQELNLEIALKISEKLDQSNIPHTLTRSNENSIYTEGETIHAKKVSDIKNRIALANENPGVPVISIHMNSYPNKNVRGIQVFYSGNNAAARQLAESLQSAFNAELQPGNTKVIKTISQNVYLFSHISNPSVLIECGFLSNSSELNQLKTDDYQEQIAQIITNALTAQ